MLYQLSYAPRSPVDGTSRWDVLRTRGRRPVSQVAIDDMWSALSFRPAAHAGSR
jgi:hypothetical protein